MNLFVSLKYLVALDDHRHFGRAALACHVTQPALSNAIRALEENFGSAIVKRGRNFAGTQLVWMTIGVAILMKGGPATIYGPRAFAAFREFYEAAHPQAEANGHVVAAN